jgi:membrane protein DedA with SNARE-associated domain
MLAQLFLIALATLASEDLTLAATGVLIAQGKLGFPQGAAACVLGIFGGDMMIYLAARTVGASALRWPWLARLVPAGAVNRGADWLNQRGLAVVFLSRFTPGLRLPTYFAAGLLPTKISTFAGYFLLASLVWTPIFLGVTGWVGTGLLSTWFSGRTAGIPAFGAVFLILALGTWGLRRLSRPALWRKLKWEFWPAWAAYLPLVPYFIYLAVKYRSLTVFTAANPAIPAGGFAGESKSAILRDLPAESVADFVVIPREAAADQRLTMALRFARRFGWPFVLKPDVGERGKGVTIVRWAWELEAYLDEAKCDTIIQRHVPGLEFGIFYYRLPDEARGHIFSITDKRFPFITGDGESTLRELISADERAACLASTYCRMTRHPIDSVPRAGERVQLVEIGSHCRGAIFLDGAQHITPELEGAMDRISQSHPGFCFGRYDVRCASAADLRAGRFTILELNGVTAEATHIYDPKIPVWRAYRTMVEQWTLAFEIGAQNRRRGIVPIPTRELLGLAIGSVK